MNFTEKYLLDNGITFEQARAAGLLPAQIEARQIVDLDVLTAYGHGRTPEARALRQAIASRV